MASFLSTPLISAEDAIANSAGFRIWCGASSVADAKANYIFSDDVREESELPARYAAMTEMEGWSYGRLAEGAGRGSFRFTGGQFHIVFSQEVGTAVTDYTATNRIAFKDSIAGFISDFMDNFEGAGQRITDITKIPFSDTFPFRGEATDGGTYIYQYGVTVNTGIY